MRERLWNMIALIVSMPVVANWLIRQAKKRPYKHIGNYMHRWWLIPRAWRLPFCIRIHHILRHDADDVLHDHPANYRTILLRGSYCEEDAFGIKRTRRAGDTACGSAERFHRIDWVSMHGVWSLFILGRNQADEWGFMVSTDGRPPRKVPWQVYVSTNDRDGVHSAKSLAEETT